jgi:hypothetical protein
MQTKCDVCEKDCVCKSCQKSIDCKYSTQENCKVCVECGKYKPSGISAAIFRDIVRSGAFADVSKETQNIENLKRFRMKWSDNNGYL